MHPRVLQHQAVCFQPAQRPTDARRGSPEAVRERRGALGRVARQVERRRQTGQPVRLAWSQVLGEMRKPHRVEDNIHALKLADKYRLLRFANLNLLSGFPSETTNDVHETLSNLYRLRFVLGRSLDAGSARTSWSCPSASPRPRTSA